MPRLARVGVAAGLVTSALLTGVSDARTTPAGPSFTAPVALTTTPGLGGFEPTLAVDSSGTTWITAHKTYHGQVSPDGRSATGVRSSSWLWTTRDGVTFTNPPGADQVGLHEQHVGDEGDLAVSPDGDVYFIDLGLVSSSFAAWHTDRDGRATLRHAQARLPHVVLGSDRPFVAAGPGGRVLVLQNAIGGTGVDEHSAAGYSYDLLSEVDGDPHIGSQTGQAEVFVSDDGGRTFGSALPHIVTKSDFCRPLVDQRDADRMLVFCNTLAGDGLFADRSHDGGRTWTRAAVAPAAGRDAPPTRSCVNFPSIAQSRDGRLHVLCTELDSDGSTVIASRLVHRTSSDFGATWAAEDVTPEPGIWEQASIAVAPDGRLGLGAYYRRDTSSTWQFRAATWREGKDPVSTEVSVGQTIAQADSGTAPGDFTQVAFGRDGRLRTAWNVADVQDVATQPTKFTGLFQVYYAQER